MRKLLLLFCFLSFITTVSAQEHDYKDDAHEFANEIGAGLGVVKHIGEERLGMGLHLHYLRSLGKRQLFSIAPGVEKIFGEHSHTSLSIGFGIRPIHPLLISIAPGLTFGHEDSMSYSGHLEMVYEFEIGVIHLGPLIEYGFTRDHSHFTVGIHAGIGF